MEITERSEEGVVILDFVGDLDINASDDVKQKIQSHLNTDVRKFIINLEKTEFVNSSGLVVLVSALKNIGRAGGILILSNMTEYVEEVFDVTNMNQIFSIHATWQKALQELVSD